MTGTVWAPPESIGARLKDGRCTFRVWAPSADRVDLRLYDGSSAASRVIALDPDEKGYYATTVDGVEAGARYSFVLDDDKEYPDPASRSQPEGVHKPSAVVDNAFNWTDSAWRAPALEDLIIYELHVGTFTREGTFEAIIPQLARLKDVGINAIELLPVSQFPGNRNWGYDGVYPYAAQNSYGGPAGLKKLIDAAHNAGIAMILDVVYNHVGPEGNYLPVFGPYFTQKYKTPWGESLNYDDAHSDEVRNFFIQSAVQWIDEFHFDGLRFDAVHAIIDASAYPFLSELTDTLRARSQEIGRAVHLIAESDLSDPRIITPTDETGFGFDSQWLDDYHHALHALVTGETQGYYADYGEMRHLATTLARGYVYAGDFSTHRKRRHGAPAHNATPEQFVVCAQNHDQVGNRLAGDRLSTLVSHDTLKLLAAAVLLGPYVPMLFMGEEYGEEAPFPYFVSHGDPGLIEAVRKGRKEEFASFGWDQEPPDPQSETTFNSAFLHPERGQSGKHRALLALNRDLIALRNATPLIKHFEAVKVDISDEARALYLRRSDRSGELLLVLNFSDRPAHIDTPGNWKLLLATDDPRYATDLAATLDTAERSRTQPDATTSVTDTFELSAQSAVLLLEETH